MAHFKAKVLIGFEDELITEKYQSFVSYSTNKVGGKPEWMQNETSSNPQCPLCGLALLLIIQVYAPLAKSPYHRTLYVFACVNPICWNKKESWVCLRSQLLDQKPLIPDRSDESVNNFEWCEDACIWEDEKSVRELNIDQEFPKEGTDLIERIASLSFDKCVDDISSPETKSHLLPLSAMAVIEGEDDMVTIDIPLEVQTNVASLMDQVKPVPQVPPESLQFVSFFISVSEENETTIYNPVNQDFSHQNIDKEFKQLSTDVDNNDDYVEKYEKAIPSHGDKLFHNFISRIQKNPGQLLRYIRDGGSPLFLYPVGEMPRHCQHCHSDLIFELQILPTIISRLQLVGSGTGHIDFGTVFVLACKDNCWDSKDSFRTEYVIVQREK